MQLATFTMASGTMVCSREKASINIMRRKRGMKAIGLTARCTDRVSITTIQVIDMKGLGYRARRKAKEVFSIWATVINTKETPLKVSMMGKDAIHTQTVTYAREPGAKGPKMAFVFTS